MKKQLPILLLAGSAVLFALGVLQLFRLRFEAGDVYPPYSSLRADPLGTMAFYESIEKVPGLSARRDVSDANRLPDGRETTYLHLAADRSDWEFLPQETFGEIERFLARGGRLVITLFPDSSTFSIFDRKDETESPKKKEGPVKIGPKQEDPKKDESQKDELKKDEAKPAPAKPEKKKSPLKKDEDERDLVKIKDRWGVDFAIVSLVQGENDVYEPVRVTNRVDFPLPADLEWHSGIVLTNLGAAWQIIYARGTNAVVVERHFGPGTVVIATDSYFLSNEALRKDRQPEFLAWLLGSGKAIVFDEAHLGVMESAGVATLMRKYHLHGLIAGLALLAGLFIWKNSVSLVPPHPDETQRDCVAGKEAFAGFVNLLRRSVRPRQLLETCFAEWKKSAARTGKYSAARLQQAEAAFRAERDGDPISTYRTISKLLGTRQPAPDSQHSTASDPRNPEPKP